MKDLYHRLTELIENGDAGVLVTVIKVSGSVPRKSGSKMLVMEGGRTMGTVGGGKIEAEAITEAEKLLENPALATREYTLTEDQGMLCGGTVELLFEPVGKKENLHIFGGGHIGQALAPLAMQAGFHVTLVDNRPEYATPARYPDEVNLLVKSFPEAIGDLTFNESTYVVIVTYKHVHDGEILEECLSHPFAYLGMIGSKRKVRKTFDQLEAAGVERERLEQVHSPVGLDIGAETPFEIAVSILAEMIAVRRGVDTPELSMKL